MPIVNLGNNQLNIDTTTAKGLEKVIGIIANFVFNAESVTSGILFGRGGDNPKIKGIQKVLERGVIGTIDDISDVDFCNLLNYVASRGNPKKNTFNPNGPREGSTPFQKKLWSVQNVAFKMQQKIDQYYATYGSSIGQDSRVGLLELLDAINLNLETLLSPSSIGINDPEILKEYPEIITATNYLNNVLVKISNYTTFSREIPTNDVAKILKFIDKIRIICGVIVGLNSAALLAAGSTLLRGKLQDDYNKINKFITPGPKVIAFLKDLIKSITSINNTAKKILSYIDTGRGLIRIAIFLIKIFNILKAFLVILPLPNLFTTAGISTLFSKTYNQVLEDQGTKKLIRRLNQLNLVLNIIIIFVTSLVSALDQIIKGLSAILLNIQSCNSGDDTSDLDGLSLTDIEIDIRRGQFDGTGAISGGGAGGTGIGIGGIGGIGTGVTGIGAGAAGGGIFVGTQTGVASGPGAGGSRTATRIIDRNIQNGLDNNSLRGLAIDLQNLINDLIDTRNRLKAFSDSYYRNKNLVDKTFFGYTIEIVTEEVVDEGITIRRRYGIARNPENIIVVESSPTFASLDLIIINEVKTLLISRGYVDLGLGTSGVPTSLALKLKNLNQNIVGKNTGPGVNTSNFTGTGRLGSAVVGQRPLRGVGLAGSAAGQSAAGARGNLPPGANESYALSTTDAPIGSRPGDFVSTGLGDSTDALTKGPFSTDLGDPTGLSGLNIGSSLGVLNAQDSQVIIESLNYLGDPNITLSAVDVTSADVAGGSFGASFGGQLTEEQEDDIVDELEDDAEVSEELAGFIDSVPKGKKLRNKVRDKLRKAIQKLIKRIKNTDPSSTYGSGNIITNIIPGGLR